MVEHIQKTGASTDEKRVAMDLADLRAGVDAGDLVVWIPTKKMVADCLTKHLTMDEETQSIRDLLQTGRMHLRYTNEGVERTLTDAQRKQEGLEALGRESMARPVPQEMDSEDEASAKMLLPPVGYSLGARPDALALSKHTGVENRTEMIGRSQTSRQIRQTPQHRAAPSGRRTMPERCSRERREAELR